MVGKIEPTSEKKIKWVAGRLRLNEGALNPFLASIMVEAAAEAGRLEDWELAALKNGEIPELPIDRELRLISDSAKRSPETE